MSLSYYALILLELLNAVIFFNNEFQTKQSNISIVFKSAWQHTFIITKNITPPYP